MSLVASKYELTISTEYVPDWNVTHAIRELFQNAIDNEVMNAENKMYFNYNKDTETLSIGNKTSKLELDTLLLGSSSKRDSEDTIGKHGEGYKIAFMVLLRCGKTINVYNYGNRETWEAKLIKSRRYNGALVPMVDVNKKAVFTKVPSHDLLIEIGGIKEEEYAEIVESNLHLKTIDEDKVVSGGIYGRALLGEDYTGKIYVNGLYICGLNNFKYGYDIRAKYIDLDRDRRLVTEFNLAWVTSQLWIVSKSSLVAELVIDQYPDVRYIHSVYADFEQSEFGYTSEAKNYLSKNVYKKFKETYGEDTIAVCNNEQYQSVAKTTGSSKIVIVNYITYETIKDMQQLPEEEDEEISTKKKLVNWLHNVQSKLTTEDILEFNDIIEELDDSPF